MPLGKKEYLYACVRAYGTRYLAEWPLVAEDVVLSSSGGMAIRLFTILYIMTALLLVLL